MTVSEGPLHGPWPKPTPEDEAWLNSILHDLFDRLEEEEPDGEAK